MLALVNGFQGRIDRLVGQTKYYLFDRHRSHTVRWSLVSACVALSLLAGALSADGKAMLAIAIVGALGGVCFLLFIYYRTELTCNLLLISTTVINVGIGTGTGTPIMISLVILVLLLVIWLIKLLLIERSFNSIRSAAPNLPIILFCVASLVSFLWGTLYVEPHARLLLEDKIFPRLMTLAIFIISPLTVLTIGNHLRSMRAINFFTWWFIIYGGINAAFRVFSIPSPEFFTSGGQLPVWTSLLALGQSAYNNKLSRLQRLLLLLIPAAWLYIQYVLGIAWLSGWAPLVLGILGVTVLYSRKLLIVIAVCIFLFVMVNADSFQQIIEAENAESGQTRVEAWDRTLDIFSRHYLFGTGPVGYFFYLTEEIGGLFQLSHNTYVDILAQTGVFGFVSYIILWVSIGWMILKTYLLSPSYGFVRGLSTSLLICYPVTLIVMMLGDWVIPFPYTQTFRGINYTIWPWMLAGLALTLRYAIAEPERSVPLIP